MKESTSRMRQKKGSILDVLLILLIVLSVLGILWREHRIKRATERQESILYTFYAQSTSMDAMTFDCIGVGDLLYTSSGELFGEITAVERVPAEVRLLSGGVSYVGAWDEDLRCCAKVEISVQGIPTDRGILVAGHRSLVGRQLPTLYSERAGLRLTLYRMNATDP